MARKKDKQSPQPKATTIRWWNAPDSAFFAIDLRALGLFRILLGTYLLYNLAIYKILPFDYLFSPEHGLFSYELLSRVKKDYFSWADIIRTDVGLYIIYALAGISYLLYLIGFKSQLLSLICFFWAITINYRHMPVRYGYDQMAECLLLIGAFLPIGQRYSLFKPGNVLHENRFASWMVFVLYFQIGCFYLFGAFSKHGACWFDGTAIGNALARINYNKPLAYVMLEHPVLIKIISYTTLIWEYAVILLILSPYRTILARNIAGISILLFHWGISFFMDVGHFKYIAVAYAVLLFYPGFFDRIDSWMGKRSKGFSQPLGFNFNLAFPGKIHSLVALYVFAGILLSNISNHAKFFRPLVAGAQYQNTHEHDFMRKQNIYPNISIFNQIWSFFPDPCGTVRYFTLEATDESGGQWDIYADAPISNPPRFFNFHAFDFRRMVFGNNSYASVEAHSQAFIYALINHHIIDYKRKRPSFRTRKVEAVMYEWPPMAGKNVVSKPGKRSVLFTADVNFDGI